MTAKELKKVLDLYPEDTEVFLYHELDECDGRLDKIELTHPILEPNEDDVNMPFIYTPHYCQGDSEAEQYWSAYGPTKPVLFLIATDMYYDFEDERKRKENA